MSSKRLGKGINAIINPDSKKNANSSIRSGVNKVKINNIKPNPDQPRRDFDKKSLEELSLSIKNKGVITPITLRKSGKHYEIVAGERRWRAAKKANLRSIPAYIIDIKNNSEMSFNYFKNMPERRNNIDYDDYINISLNADISISDVILTVRLQNALNKISTGEDYSLRNHEYFNPISSLFTFGVIWEFDD